MNSGKKKKIVFYVTEAFPHNDHGGASLTSLNISKILHDMYNVILILIDNGKEKNFNKINKKLFKKVLVIKYIPSKKFIYSIDNYLFGVNFQKKIFNMCKIFLPEIIFSYGFNSLEAISKIDKPKIGLVGDPLYLPLQYRKKEIIRNINISNLIKSIRFLLRFYLIDYFVLKKLKKRINLVVRRFQFVGCFSHHHAKYDLDCEYVKTPLIQKSSRNMINKSNNKLDLAHVGHLKGTVTLNSFYNLVNIIVPAILNKIEKKNLQINVYGKYYENLPNILKNKILKLSVFKFHGHIDKNFDKELNKSDAIIACNNIDLGNRVRILTALSNKTLVITHRANIRGIPELIHNYNCLVGNNMDEIVEICLNLKKNLNRNYIIKKNAFKTAQRNFSFYSFKKMIRDKIEKNFL